MKFLLRNLEIILSLAGLAVIFGVTTVLSSFGHDAWTVAAITATSVGVLHGLIFWLVRRRQHAVRRQTIREIQHMLKDLINNQLTIIQATSSMQQLKPEKTEELSERVSRSVANISTALHELSDESLKRWKQQYGLYTGSLTEITGES
jgi:hypothetical protein